MIKVMRFGVLCTNTLIVCLLLHATSVFASDPDATNNTTISNTDGDIVEVLDDAGVMRLAVDAIVSTDVSLDPFTTKLDFDAVGTSVTTSDTTLKTVTAKGKLDFIALASGSSNYEVIIVVDSVEEIRIEMGELGADIGLSNATGVPLWVETADKNFRYAPAEGDDFTTNFTIKAKSTSGTQTIKWLVKWRET